MGERIIVWLLGWAVAFLPERAAFRFHEFAVRRIEREDDRDPA